MTSVITKLIQVQEQVRVLHWQTKIYSRHKAYGSFYNDLGEMIDELVEIYQGKYNRISFQQQTFDLIDIDNVKLSDMLDFTIETLYTELPSLIDQQRDTDILNLRDSIVGLLNRFKYILTLK